MTEKKELILRLPEDIDKILEAYKDASGMSKTNIIYNAIVWWLVKEGLLDLGYVKYLIYKGTNNDRNI